MKRYFAAIVLSMLGAVALMAQPTRLKGTVNDMDTGEAIPLAAIFFDGTTIGTTSDFEGNFVLETRDSTVSLVSVQALGYEPRSFYVVNGAFSVLKVKLKSTKEQLEAAVVRPDDSYLKSILKRIDASRADHDPDNYPAYSREAYSKVEFGIFDPEKKLGNKVIRKNFNFIFDHIDTSAVSGRPFLSLMLSETRSVKYHKDGKDQETVTASKISGLNETNILKQFTGTASLRSNFYDNHLNAFNTDIPSPLSYAGRPFYNYYLIDSLQVEGRKTYLIRFHPKKWVSSPVFDGEMKVDAADAALLSINVRLDKVSNINLIRDMAIDAEYAKGPDSLWFQTGERLYVDFAPTRRDSSKILSFLAKREIRYGEPDLSGRDFPESIDNTVIVREDATSKDNAFWEAERPITLSDKETSIYEMVDQVQATRLYRNTYDIAYALATGYLEKGPIGFGPYTHFVSFNSTEGLRLGFGVRTSKEFSRKVRLGAFGSYGFRDHKVKGSAKVEYLIKRNPTRKLTLSGSHDFVQLGKGNSPIHDESNIFNSIFSRTGSDKRGPLTRFGLYYDHEWTAGINTRFTSEYTDIYSSASVALVTPEGIALDKISSMQGGLTARFSWKETVNRGPFTKNYIFSKYPVVTLGLAGGEAWVGGRTLPFARAELSLEGRIRMHPVGASQVWFKAGKIFGSVPYPLLCLHEGNNTYIYDKSAFSCMGYYEFASDTWAKLIWEHNFGGWLFGKIPLIKKLGWRETATFKGVWGTLSTKNRGNAPILLPEGLSTLEVPYLEAGVGISNIFRLFRVDFIWRLTHRDIRPFTVNAGLEFNF